MTWVSPAVLLGLWLWAVYTATTLAGLVHLLPAIAVAEIAARRAPRVGPAGAAPSSDPTAPRAARLAFIDRGRALAVGLMIPTHVVNALLDESYRRNDLFHAWQFVSGQVAVLFLVVAGFVAGWFAGHGSSRHDAARLRERLRRCALLVLAGYAMHLPTLNLLTIWTAPERWRRFAEVDILQTMGVALALVSIIDVAVRGARRRWWVCAATSAAAVAAVAGSVLVDGAPVPALPRALAAYLTPAYGSLFPLAPWSAYLFGGAALAVAVTGMRDAAGAAPATLRRIGLGLIVMSLILIATVAHPHRVAGFWQPSPALVLLRFGLSVFAVGVIGAVCRSSSLGWVTQVWSTESLFIYVLHVIVIYGSVINPGLVRAVGRDMGPAAVTAWTLALLVVSTLAAAWWQRRRAGRPTRVHSRPPGVDAAPEAVR